MALSCFFVCVMSAYRGYAQGHSDMVPTAVSQVLEALTKLIVGLFLAWYLLYLGFGSEISAAGAILVGCVVYVILVVALRVVSKDDLSLMPKGEKIAKLLRIR